MIDWRIGRKYRDIFPRISKEEESMTKHTYNDSSLASDACEDVNSIIEKIEGVVAIDNPLSIMFALVDRLAFLIAKHQVKIDDKSALDFFTDLLGDKVNLYLQIRDEDESE